MYVSMFMHTIRINKIVTLKIIVEFMNKQTSAHLEENKRNKLYSAPSQFLYAYMCSVCIRNDICLNVVS